VTQAWRRAVTTLARARWARSVRPKQAARPRYPVTQPPSATADRQRRLGAGPLTGSRASYREACRRRSTLRQPGTAHPGRSRRRRLT